MRNGNGEAKVEMNDELKVIIATEVRAQMAPVVKEIVREVITEVRSVMTDVLAPIYDGLNCLRNTNSNATTLPLHAISAGTTSLTVPSTVVSYPSESAILAEVYTATSSVACTDVTAATAATQNVQLPQFLKENGGTAYDSRKRKMYMNDGISSKSTEDIMEEPIEPRGRESTSDCVAYNYIYYNTASAVPIMSMLKPDSNTYVCQKVPNIFLGKEGGKISFLVDTRAVPLRDLTADNLGSWTCRFTAHMKSRKYMVKKGKVVTHIKQYGQVYTLPQEYDYILHRQYYCHGNTIGPSTIRKNIWYLSNKLQGGDIIGCAIISYEIGDNVTVKVSKLRHRILLNNNSSENLHLMKPQVTGAPEEADVSSVAINPNAELQRFVNNVRVP